MVIRKRRTPTPNFRLPPPYNPMFGQHAGLSNQLSITRLALFQVAVEDTHDNYLVCRGFDPETGHFYDGENGVINVAKPYGRRGLQDYEIAEVLICSKIRGRLGENAGKATTTIGQPADLDEEIVLLTDDDSKPICWMHLTEKSRFVYAVQMQTQLTATAPAQGDLWTDKLARNLNKEVTVNGSLLGSQTLAAEKWGYVMQNEDGDWLLIAAECPE